jgi:hypothetical protein
VRRPVRLILVSTVLLAAARITVAQSRVADEVRDGIVRPGSAGVIVGVRASFEPEGRLSNFAIDRQQRTICEAVDTVVAGVGGAIEVRQRYRVGAPGLPTITTVGTIGRRFLGIAWTSGAGPSPTTHRLDFYSGEALVTQVTTGPAPFAYLPIPPGVSGVYGVRVTAFNGAIAGSASTELDFTIGPSCSVPAAPIVFGGVAGTTATVNWLPVQGASFCLLSAGTTPGGMQHLPQTSVGSDTTASASGLPPGFLAGVRVIAVNACGQQGPATDFLVQ